MRRLIVFGVAILVLGCKGQHSEPATPTPGATAVTSAAARPSVVASSAAPAAKPRKVVINTKLLDFTYFYPAEAAAIPDLKGWLDADIARRKADTEQGSRDELAEQKKNPEFFAHTWAHSSDWQVVANLPGWLSLSAQRWEYTGGAHGNPWSEGLLWDHAANQRRNAVDLFTSKTALSAAIREPFCAALDQQRARKRGAPVNRSSGDSFDECIDPVASTLILGSADKARFTRIGVLVNPYEAGPYVEGNYEVTLPVTDAVLKAVKPEYRALFAKGR